MDFFPTVLEATGIKNLESNSATGASGRDGVSLLPLLKQTGTLAERDLFWHYPHHQHYQLGGAMPYGAIRSGDYKLIEFFNDMRVELYNLADDAREQQDLVSSQPDRVHAFLTVPNR
jgi:arylsulfatase A